MADNSVRATWANMNPERKRSSVMAIAVALIALVLWVFVSGGDKGPKRRSTEQQLIKDPLTAGNNALGLEAIAARVDKLGNALDAQQSKNEDAARAAKVEMAALRRDSIKNERAMREELTDSRDEIDRLRKELDGANTRAVAAAANAAAKVAATAAVGSGSGSATPGTAAPAAAVSEEWDLFNDNAADGVPAPAAGAGAAVPDPGRKLSIKTYEAAKTAVAAEPVATPARQTGRTAGGISRENAKVAALQVPAGSIISGPMITGLDAPTGQTAKDSPFPALIRVKRDAILPNDYALDIRDCFILAGGYGDLASSRVMLRAEKLSCITEEGGVLESQLDAYAVGEDGKVGMRGRLVQRLGGALAASAFAGFASGFAQALAPQRVPVISNSAQVDPFQTINPSRALAGGFGQGTSTALERLADYYMNLVEQSFPVIEVDALRNVEFVLTSGVSLPLPTGRVIKN